MKKTFLLLFATVLLTTGCMPRYYPGALGAHVPPIIQSPTKDHKEYTFASLDFNEGMTWEEYEDNSLLKLRYMKIRSMAHADVNMGLMAYGGRYHVSRVERYKGDYTYFGVGPELSACLHVKLLAIELGVGLHAQGVFELGQYYTFRKESDRDGLADNVTIVFYPMLSLYPLIRYNFNDIKSLGIQCGIGFPGFLSPSLLYQNKSHVIWATWFPDQSDSGAYHDAFSIGIGLIR